MMTKQLIILITIILVVSLPILLKQQKPVEKQVYIVKKQDCQNKAFMQSPEYRCSTKCFDCIKNRTFNHLNKSHGNPRYFDGLR
jgi:hypothetical protein